MNVTLFCSPTDELASGYVAERPLFHEWVRFQEVTTVTVKQVKFRVEDEYVQSITEDDLKNSRGEEPDDF